MKTIIEFEVTDTYCGEVNYSWVRRGVAESKDNEDFSDLAAIRRVKKAIGWNGIPCKIENYSDIITIKPIGICQICFITFYTFGNASENI